MKNKELSELLESREKVLSEDIEYDLLHKINVSFKAGSRIKIIWKDRGLSYPDFGYIFEIPGYSQIDENDAFVHIPEPRNPDGKETSPPQFLHLLDLLSNKMIKEILITD